jgi:hypothetical protein
VFPLDAHPSGGSDAPSLDLRLDDDALARKLEAAGAYAELRGEVEAALGQFGPDAFRRECLWSAGDPFAVIEHCASMPHYERVGRDRQSRGRYTDVITLDTHVRPLARALRARDTGPEDALRPFRVLPSTP